MYSTITTLVFLAEWYNYEINKMLQGKLSRSRHTTQFAGSLRALRHVLRCSLPGPLL